MPRRFQITLEGKGFLVPVDGDVPIVGFYTNRRVLADSPKDAEEQAIASLKQEDKFLGLVETTEREMGFQNGWRVRAESIREQSWFRWHFSKCSQSFICYQDDAA